MLKDNLLIALRELIKKYSPLNYITGCPLCSFQMELEKDLTKCQYCPNDAFGDGGCFDRARIYSKLSFDPSNYPTLKSFWEDVYLYVYKQPLSNIYTTSEGELTESFKSKMLELAEKHNK